MSDFCVIPSDIAAAVHGITAESTPSDLEKALQKVRAIIAGYPAEGIHPIAMAVCVLLVKALEAPEPDAAEQGFAACMSNRLHLMPLNTVQQFLLSPLFDEVSESNKRGERRAVFAQVWMDGAVLKVLTTEQCEGVAKLLNGSQIMFTSAAERWEFSEGSKARFA